MSDPKNSADKYGSIVFIVGRQRAYGIRGRLHLPTDYFVYDKKQLAKLDPAANADKFNYFDAYFSLSGDSSGENAPVEAGVFKYAGEKSTNWNTIRTGVAGWNFHGDLEKESFSGKPHMMQLAFVPGEKDIVDLKIDGMTIRNGGPMPFKKQIQQSTYDAGGLYPKASIGMCNYIGGIRFGRITFSDLHVCHDRTLKESSWIPFTDFTKHNKFTHGDWIDSRKTPFSAWTPTPRIGGKRK